MIEEQIDISNPNSKGTLDIIYHDGLELIYDKEPLLISWDGDGQYSWRYAQLNKIDKTKLNNFIKFEEFNSNNNLANSEDELLSFLSEFVEGEYSITKYKTQNKEAGRYLRLSDYSIELPKHEINNLHEQVTKSNFNSYFIEQYQKNNSTPSIIDWTTDGFSTLQDPVIAFKFESQIDKTKINKFKNEIIAERYPYCLILSNFAENENSLNCYCLGSIEILIAYKQLNINPRFTEIKKINDENLRLDDKYIQELNGLLFSWQLKSIFDRYFDNEEEVKKIMNLIGHPFKSFIRHGQTKEFWPNKSIKSEGYFHNNKPNGIVTNYYPDGKIKSIWFYNKLGERIRPIKQYFPTGELRSEFIYNEGDEFGIDRLFRIDGTLQREMYFLEGVHYIMMHGKYYIKDGKSEIIYYDDGIKEEYVAYYKDGQKVDWKKFDRSGNLIDEMKNSA